MRKPKRDTLGGVPLPPIAFGTVPVQYYYTNNNQQYKSLSRKSTACVEAETETLSTRTGLLFADLDAEYQVFLSVEYLDLGRNGHSSSAPDDDQ
jgi:hypothetical protein